MFTLESLAAQFQDKTGCSDKEAAEVAFVMAMLVADLAGDKAAGDYFQRRANEVAVS